MSGMKFFGFPIEDRIAVDTAFLTQMTTSSAMLTGCLEVHSQTSFDTFDDFLAFFREAYIRRYFD